MLTELNIFHPQNFMKLMFIIALFQKGKNNGPDKYWSRAIFLIRVCILYKRLWKHHSYLQVFLL